MTTLQVGPLQLELRSRTYEIAERIDLSQSVVSTLLDKAITGRPPVAHRSRLPKCLTQAVARFGWPLA